MKYRAYLLLTFLISFLFLTGSLHAFNDAGCGGDCKNCHSLSKQEAINVLKKMKVPDAKVLDIQLSPVKSLWEVSFDTKGNRGLVYIDFSKKFLLPGPIVEISSGANKTAEKAEKIQVIRKIDVSKIPLDKALVMGNANNSNSKKVIVFTDPDCPYCGKLHQEMKKVIAKRKDIVFYVKLFPLPGHKDAYWKSKSIVCDMSIKLLEDNFEKKPIQKKECDTKEIDNNIKLSESLGINSTPTIIMPDGRVYSGALPSEKLIDLIDNPSLANGRQ